MTQRRNDPHHFPTINGRGHRRKVTNQPLEARFDLTRLDPVERRALELVADADAWLTAEDCRHARAETARIEGWLRGGEPGE